MRLIVGLALGIAAALWLACSFDMPQVLTSNPVVQTQWRRTVDGWERLSALSVPRSGSSGPDSSINPPHPVVLSILVALLSVLALVAFSPTRAATAHRRTRSNLHLPQGELSLETRAWLDESSLS